MWGRIAVGAGSLGLYGWRVQDPKGSYAAFYDVSEWLTSWVLSEDGALGLLRNFVNIVLVDQADGFLLGMAFVALVSVVLWPVRRCGRWCAHRVRGLVAGARRDQRSRERRAFPDGEPGVREYAGRPRVEPGPVQAWEPLRARRD